MPRRPSGLRPAFCVAVIALLSLAPSGIAQSWMTDASHIRISIPDGEEEDGGNYAYGPNDGPCMQRLRAGKDCWVILTVRPGTDEPCRDLPVIRPDCTIRRAVLERVTEELLPECERIATPQFEDFDDPRAYHVAFSDYLRTYGRLRTFFGHEITCWHAEVADVLLRDAVPFCTRSRPPADPVYDAPICFELS